MPLPTGTIGNTPRAVDFNTLAVAPPIIDSLTRHLPLADLVSLSNTSVSWSRAMSPQAFSHAARAAFLARERGLDVPWPALGDAPFSLDDLPTLGLPEVNTLRNLELAIKRLPSMSLDTAIHAEAPGLLLEMHPPLISSAPQPEFVAIRPGADSGILLVTPSGLTRSPAALANHTVVPSKFSGMPVVDLMPSSGRNDALLVRHNDSDVVSLYHAGADRLIALGPSRRGAELGAISEGGHMVAGLVLGDDSDHSRLVVVESSTGRTVSHVALPGGNYANLAVDASGTAWAGSRNEGREIAPGGHVGQPSAVNWPGMQVPYGHLSITSAVSLADIVLHSRHGGPVTTLKGGGDAALALALSPGRAMAAVTYSGGALSIFDLTGEAGELQPALRCQIPQNDTQMGAEGVIPSFTSDGSALHLAYAKTSSSQAFDHVTGFLSLPLTN
jgi:hypothetical protein